MPDTITRVQPPLEFLPPAFNSLVRRVVSWAFPFVIRFQTTVRQIEAENVETLVDLYRQFQDGKIRFLLAFRHPSATDPYCVGQLVWRLVPQAAKQQQVSLKHPVHSHFMYDRGIPIWAGAWVTWLYPRLGGIPIRRGKIDLMGLKAARDIFANGDFPLAAAPEGATNGHNEIISPLEPGVSQLGFWCVEDMVKQGRSQEVFILPVGIEYRYVTPPWAAVEKIITQLEIDTGIHSPDMSQSQRLDEILLYKRLYHLGEHLLSVMEDFYTRFYHKALSTSHKAGKSDPASLPSDEAFSDRLNALLNAALEVAEDYFNLQPRGSLIDRCRRLEQAGWDCIYREDIKLETASPLEKGLADRVAEEADLRVWHMRLVESFVAVTGNYVNEKPTVDRFAETTLLVWDMVCRIKGGNPFERPKLGNQKAFLKIGNPISVSDRWDSYRGGRKNAKQAVADLTQDLQIALESMLTKQ
ncbi:1-acyl-sn-glycerol-3-phosphate acyltransferase [Leptolyngbyaceae cyanobacterium UHCC 1019]